MSKKKIIWVVIFCIGFAVRCTHIFQPVDTDSWREADVASMAKNFYQNGTNIFHPQINYGGNGPGYVESEFQIYSYSIAVCYKLFGFWEPTGRIISFLASLVAMVFFFKLSKYLLESSAALISSLFFALSPLLMVISIGIQPESLMFCFYVCAAYSFIRWLDSGSKKFYWLTIVFTALALLAKIPSINIGIFFLILIIYKKGWKFLIKTRVLILGALSIIPSVLWYSYSHKFYVLYGNSLGMSNEYPWIGWDFFTKPHFLKGIIQIELSYVWTWAGPLIILLAIVFTKVFKREDFLIGLLWYFSVLLFYIITCRTTADNWAWYYHIFSVPPVAILSGIGAVELYKTYFPYLHLNKRNHLDSRLILKSRVITFLLTVAGSVFLLSVFTYFVKTKPEIYQVSKNYSAMKEMKKIIPENTLILTTGGPEKNPDGYALAVDIGYFYYWLNRKGYSISFENLSLPGIKEYKNKNVNYFVAQKSFLDKKPGLEDSLDNTLKILYENNACVLFHL